MKLHLLLEDSFIFAILLVCICTCLFVCDNLYVYLLVILYLHQIVLHHICAKTFAAQVWFVLCVFVHVYACAFVFVYIFVFVFASYNSAVFASHCIALFTGVVAAAGLFGLDHVYPRLGEDHERCNLS